MPKSPPKFQPQTPPEVTAQIEPTVDAPTTDTPTQVLETQAQPPESSPVEAPSEGEGLGVSDKTLREMAAGRELVGQPVSQSNETINLNPVDEQVYLEAARRNAEIEFMARMEAARKDHGHKPYTVPPVPEAIAETTRLEMEAGRQLVAQRQKEETARRALMAEREAAERKANPTVAVFVPGNYTGPNIRTAASAHLPTNTFRPVG